MVKNVTVDVLSLVSNTTLDSLQLPKLQKIGYPLWSPQTCTHKAHSHVNIKKKSFFFRRRPGVVLYTFNFTMLEAEVGKKGYELEASQVLVCIGSLLAKATE